MELCLLFTALVQDVCIDYWHTVDAGCVCRAFITFDFVARYTFATVLYEHVFLRYFLHGRMFFADGMLLL